MPLNQVFGVQMGEIVFEDEKALEEARAKLNEKVYGGQKVAVDVRSDKSPFNVRNRLSDPFSICW